MRNLWGRTKINYRRFYSSANGDATNKKLAN